MEAEDGKDDCKVGWGGRRGRKGGRWGGEWIAILLERLDKKNSWDRHDRKIKRRYHGQY